MKWNKAMHIINSRTETVFMDVQMPYVSLCSNVKGMKGPFLDMDLTANGWNVATDYSKIEDEVQPQDLALAMDIIKKIAKTPVEMRFPEKLSTIKLSNTNDSYFVWYEEDHEKLVFDLSTKDESKRYGIARFTDNEIEELKQHHELAIDWNKAIIETDDYATLEWLKKYNKNNHQL